MYELWVISDEGCSWNVKRQMWDGVVYGTTYLIVQVIGSVGQPVIWMLSKVMNGESAIVNGSFNTGAFLGIYKSEFLF